MQKFLALAAIAAATVTACIRRDIYREGVSPVPVTVCMDWRELGGDPDGATIIFYPEDGTRPYTFRTNNVGRADVDVPEGLYTVVAFNRTPSEYATMHFSGLDSLGAAQAVLEFQNTWAGTADSIGRTVFEPEVIVCGRADHFFASRLDTCRITPRRMVYDATITVEADSIQSVRSVRAFITGMAGAQYLSTRTAASATATQIIEKWTVKHSPSDYTRGSLVGTFSCFGLPSGTRLAADNRLTIKALLVDGRTVVSRSFDIGETIRQDDDVRTVSATAGGIRLPNVMPDGGSPGGFDVGISDWGDDKDIIVSGF